MKSYNKFSSGGIGGAEFTMHVELTAVDGQMSKEAIRYVFGVDQGDEALRYDMQMTSNYRDLNSNIEIQAPSL